MFSGCHLGPCGRRLLLQCSCGKLSLAWLTLPVLWDLLLFIPVMIGFLLLPGPVLDNSRLVRGLLMALDGRLETCL